MAAMSTSAGTQVVSCMRMRPGMNSISASLRPRASQARKGRQAMEGSYRAADHVFDQDSHQVGEAVEFCPEQAWQVDESHRSGAPIENRCRVWMDGRLPSLPNNALLRIKCNPEMTALRADFPDEGSEIENTCFITAACENRAKGKAGWRGRLWLRAIAAIWLHVVRNPSNLQAARALGNRPPPAGLVREPIPKEERRADQCLGDADRARHR